MNESMYFLLKMVIFQLAMLVFTGVIYIYIFPKNPEPPPDPILNGMNRLVF